MISCEELGKRFSSRWVFRRVSFSLVRGHCLLVTGANGSGKSTLLRILAGLESASEGTISQGFDSRRQLGYSAADLRLYPSLTAREHIELAATLRGGDGSRDGIALLERVDLSRNADEQTSTFSTGMRARLKLALALMNGPQLLLLDEPGAGLDERGRNLLEEIVEEQRNGGAVIVATNDSAERRFGDLELVLGC